VLLLLALLDAVEVALEVLLPWLPEESLALAELVPELEVALAVVLEPALPEPPVPG
jgi:hypothetical protein